MPIMKRWWVQGNAFSVSRCVFGPLFYYNGIMLIDFRIMNQLCIPP